MVKGYPVSSLCWSSSAHRLVPQEVAQPQRLGLHVDRGALGEDLSAVTGVDTVVTQIAGAQDHTRGDPSGRAVSRRTGVGHGPPWQGLRERPQRIHPGVHFVHEARSLSSRVAVLFGPDEHEEIVQIQIARRRDRVVILPPAGSCGVEEAHARLREEGDNVTPCGPG